MLSGPVRLRLKIRRCEHAGCARLDVPWRPEAEGALALAQHEFGLDVIALVGTLRQRDHRSVPEIHALLRARGVEIAERSVTNLLDRYDELLATSLANSGRLAQGVASDGQTSIRRAVAAALPEVAHQLCQFRFLREAANPVYEADRHAKKELKKQVRGVRPIGRAVEGRSDAQAETVRGYCAAVRSAITDAGRAPLAAPGLKLKGRLEKVADSLDRTAQKGALRHRSRACAS